MKADLFIESNRKGFSDLKITKDEIKKTIFGHPEFNVYSKQTTDIFNLWRAKNAQFCKSIDSNTKPKEFIHALSEDLLKSFTGLKLIDKYDLYQHLMVYWFETMQDDSYLIVSDGWAVGNEVEYEKKEFEGKLITKSILISRYFNDLKLEIENLEAARDTCLAEIESLEEEHSGEEGYFTSLDKVNKGTVAKRLKDIREDKEAKEENKIINIGVASHTPLQRGIEFIDINKKDLVRIVGQEFNSAKYIYKNNISEVDINYNKKYNIPENFKKIDELIVDGIIIYEIYKNLKIK
jgi:type I restriction enzyme M protein